MIRPAARWAAGVLVALVLVAGIAAFAVHRFQRAWSPDPETITAISLQGLREQNRLSAFVASYVAVVTSTQTRFGLSARKTLILPGLVRYEVDMGKLRPADVTWEAGAHRLSVVLPAVEAVGPEIDMTRVRDYDSGGLLLRLTDAATALDAANRAAAQADLLKQARGPVPMGLARDATRRAIARSFALPLRAAGLDAHVRVRFADEPGFPAEDDAPMDRSRTPAEVYRDDP